ncbi:MAG: Gfo/Idh/MocA family protein [Nitrososphaerales archaeon]
MDSVSFGLVGYGRFSRMHVKALSQIPGASVSSVSAGSEKSAQEAEKELEGVPVYLDYDEFLRSSKVDAVDIVTPNYLHAGLAIKALNSGKDVYLEKPMAISISEARKLAEAQKRSGRKIQIGFENRYSNFWKAVKATLERGDIDSPILGKIESWRFPMRPGSQGWKYDKQRVGHQLIEEAIHYSDLANWLFGENSKPRSVFGFIDNAEAADSGILKSAFFVVEFEPNKRFIIIDTLQGFGTDLSLTIAGEKGALIGAVRSDSDDSPNVESYLKLKDKNDKGRTTNMKLSGQLSDLTSCLKDFVEAIQKGKETTTVTVNDGFVSLAICDAAVNSMRSGKPEPVQTL